jgi:hypothetical protein
MEDAGASAVVFHSLFEEQLRPGNHPMRRASGNGGAFSSEALGDYSDEPDFIEQVKGIMSQNNCPDPTAFERAQYTRALNSYPSGQPSISEK